MPIITAGLGLLTLYYLWGFACDVATFAMICIVAPPILIWHFLVPERVKDWFNDHSWVHMTAAWIACVFYVFWGVAWLDGVGGERKSMIDYWMSQDASTLKVFVPFGFVMGSALWTKLL